jgi:hypothetical protein
MFRASREVSQFGKLGGQVEAALQVVASMTVDDKVG